MSTAVLDYEAPSTAPRSVARGMILPPVVGIGFALAMHFIVPLFGAYSERILLDIAIAIIAAVSLTIVNGFTGQFSIGHAAFMALGAYVGGWVSYYAALLLNDTTKIDATLFGSAQWILFGGAIVAGLVSAAMGWLVGLPSLRLKGDYLAIVTLGFGEILRVLLQQTNRQAFTRDDFLQLFREHHYLQAFTAVGGASGFESIPKVTNLFWAFLFVAGTILFAYRLKTSSYGRAMLSIREDEIAAEAMGINTTKLKVRAFMFAAFFAGVAGTLYAHQPGTVVRPIDAGFSRSFDIVMMVVLGGLGSISGSVLAAIIITALNAFLTPFGPWRMISFALMLILLMIFRPKGLFGIREIWDYFKPKQKIEPRGFEPRMNTDEHG